MRPAYWPGTAEIGPRLYSTTTPGLAAIDAKTGKLVTTFGVNGVLPGIAPTSPPAIYKNILITQGDREPGKGLTVKGFDVVSGKLVWTFYLKAQPGDPNRSTWLAGSARSRRRRRTSGVSSRLTSSAASVFIPVEKVGNDYWGGSNHGNNLTSDSLVALDANTGKMKWFRQLVHHDIWDYDLAAAPILFDVRRGGRTIPRWRSRQDGAALHLQPRNRRADLRDRGARCRRPARRWTSPTAVPGQAAAAGAQFAEAIRAVQGDTRSTRRSAKRCGTVTLEDSVPYDPWRVGQDILVFPGAQGGGNWHGSAFNKPLGLIITNVMTAASGGICRQADGGRRPPGDAARGSRSGGRGRGGNPNAPPWAGHA